jgi:hypothetical protein
MSLLTCPRTVKPRSELLSGLSNLASDGRDAGSNAEGSLGRQAIVGQGRSQFYEWCDDGILPLICPTCQKRVLEAALSMQAVDPGATLHGVVFDILIGTLPRRPFGPVPGAGEGMFYA